MAYRLLIGWGVRVDQGDGTVLEALSFEAGGEASNNPQPTVLSCGGIFIPRRTIPSKLKKWRQIINLPGADLSATIFGFNPEGPETPESNDPLEPFRKREFFN